MATAASAKDKKLTLQQQIEALQKQMEALDQEAIHELKHKLSDARKIVTTLEGELASLTGKPAGEAKAKRVRRPSITDEHLQPQLLAVMAKNCSRKLGPELGRSSFCPNYSGLNYKTTYRTNSNQSNCFNISFCASEII